MLSLILALIITAGVFGIFTMNETVASAAPRVPRPENFRISASEDGCYQLSWDTSSEVSGYKVYRSVSTQEHRYAEQIRKSGIDR